tara:strand:- start:662 stop:1888 length:1227 start_codon:yes stop_codon:yes gene_type:complete
VNWSHVSSKNSTLEGFKFAGITAGLKDSRKKDLALILAPQNSICSGLFTQSVVRASCIDICEKRIQKTSGLIRAILINSGHANACTGEGGKKDVILTLKNLSDLLDIEEEKILMCSTGVIGVPIPMNKLLQNLPNLVKKLDEKNFNEASEAILTTDLVTKRIAIQTNIDGKPVKISGFAKGSGMIYPNMATMLAFLFCDVSIDKSNWDILVKQAVDCSFNAISVDGETSTNDSFMAINGGDKLDIKYLPIISEGLQYVCQYLAKSIVRDGEGANCLLEVTVKGTKNNIEAIQIGKAIVNSSLTKTAIHGHDPNWGRIIAAAGNAGIRFNFEDVDLFIGGYKILQKGRLFNFDKELIRKYIKSKMGEDSSIINQTIDITLDINSGLGLAKVWGCDFSKKYIEINSEYTT